MKKLNILWLLLLFVSFSGATAPTVPSTLSPINNSIYFNDPTLTCSGSTDAEDNPINYTMYYATSDPFIQGAKNFYGDYTVCWLSQTTGTNNERPIWIAGNGDTTTCNNALASASPRIINLNPSYIGDYCFRSDFNATDQEVVTKSSHPTEVNMATCMSNCLDISNFPDSTSTRDLSGETDGWYFGWATQSNNGAGTSAVTNMTWYSADGLDNGSMSPYNTDNSEFWSYTKSGDSSFSTSSTTRTGNCNSHPCQTYMCWDLGGINTVEISNNEAGSTTFAMESLGLQSTWWNCKACDNNAECSSLTDYRTITQINFTSCTTGNKAQFFDLLNETGSQDLGVYTQDCAYTVSSSQDSKSFNFNLSAATSYYFCSDPADYSISLSGFCQYDSGFAGYSYPRQYYFDAATLTGAIQRNYSLYQLEDSLSTGITFTVSEAGVPLENRIIQIQRYDISTGNYRTVSMLKTDSNGQDISYLEQTTAFYKVCVFEIGNPDPVSCSSAFHITGESYAIALTTSSALSWSSLVGVAHNLTFDSVSDQFELTYSDPNEKTTQFCLEVYDERFTQRILVANNCLSSNSGTIQTSVDAINGTTYSAYAFATLFTNTTGQYASDTFLLSQITHSYGMSEAFQNNGLFFIWLLVAVFSLLAFYSPSLALLLAPLPVIFGSFSGIIAIPMGTALALYLGFIILAVVVGGKE
jgi:hypothetical protein